MTRARERGLRHASIWIGAVIVGLSAVFYARLISLLQDLFLSWFGPHRILISLASPLLFVIATLLVRKCAPDAKGSGIPQVLEAIEIGTSHGPPEDPWRISLVSLWTAIIKVASSAVGILGGASIGREGPTVQIASAVIAGTRLHRVFRPALIQRFAAFGFALAGLYLITKGISSGTR